MGTGGGGGGVGGFLAGGVTGGTALLGGSHGILGSALGIGAGADAMQATAEAQQRMAGQDLAFQQQSREQALQAAQPSFDQMQAIQRQYTMSSNLLSTQLNSLNNQYQLYQTVAQQASDLAGGKSAAALAPLQQQQNLQSQSLQNKLRDQLGSGYAGSSAGAAALANMAMQQNFATSQAQQQATGMYLGAAQSLGGQYTQGLNSAYTTASGLNLGGLQASTDFNKLQASAIIGNKVDYNNSISSAGAQYAGDLYGSQAMTNLVGGIAGKVAGAAIGGGGAH